MQWLTHSDKRVGVEGDFAIDADGHLTSTVEDLREIGLVPWDDIAFGDGLFARVVGHAASDRVFLQWRSPLRVGPIRRVYIAQRVYCSRDKAIEAEFGEI